MPFWFMIHVTVVELNVLILICQHCLYWEVSFGCRASRTRVVLADRLHWDYYVNVQDYRIPNGFFCRHSNLGVELCWELGKEQETCQFMCWMTVMKIGISEVVAQFGSKRFGSEKCFQQLIVCGRGSG